MTTLLVHEPHGLCLVDRRPWDALTTRLRGAALDRRLAAGEIPESDRSLAVRAGVLVTPSFRRRLARHWTDIVVPPRRRSLHQVPLAHGRIRAAHAQIAELVDVLLSGRPVAARGVAGARLLLVDGTSPVYGARSDGDLSVAVARVRAMLHDAP